MTCFDIYLGGERQKFYTGEEVPSQIVVNTNLEEGRRKQKSIDAQGKQDEEE